MMANGSGGGRLGARWERCVNGRHDPVNASARIKKRIPEQFLCLLDCDPTVFVLQEILRWMLPPFLQFPEHMNNIGVRQW